MSSLPPDNLENLLDVGSTKNPLKTIQDVKSRLDLFLELNKPPPPPKTPASSESSEKSPK